jgi:hypothetical protein
VRRPIEPTVEIFFVHRAAAGEPISGIIASSICLADVARELVLRLPAR